MESQTDGDPSLHRAVILLDNIIEVGNNAAAASSTIRALLFKLLDNGRVGRIPHIDLEAGEHVRERQVPAPPESVIGIMTNRDQSSVCNVTLLVAIPRGIYG